MLKGRVWLRRVMPRTSMVAVGLFVLWLFVSDKPFYTEYHLDALLGSVTFLVVSFTIVYYGLRALLWLKRNLLWRVRRRLIITYLFVGLTPIILLTLLGILSAVVGSSQALSRIATVQVNTTEQETLSSARALSDELGSAMERTDRRSIQTWLDERTALLQSVLPGASVAVWQGTTDEDAKMLGQRPPAQFVSTAGSEDIRGVGGDTTPTGAPLPAWLSEQDEWEGLAYIPPPTNSDEVFGSPSVRALVRRKTKSGGVTVLLVVPVSRALLRQLHGNTGIDVRPFFFSPNKIDASKTESSITLDEKNAKQSDRANQQEIKVEINGRRVDVDFKRDQLGEPLTGSILNWYPVFLPATNWLNGAKSDHMAFVIDCSWMEAGKQLLGDQTLGQFWHRALVAVGVAFLFFELLALFTAAWMTRAVTGTVHKLYRATEFIKRGDFSHRVRVRSHDQLGELAQAFNEMSGDIESLLQERVERERLQREVEIAAEVQAQLFPRSVPLLATAEIVGECRAARGVAGDYYDYIEVMPGLAAVALGDVSGKGISAALVMSNLQAALRAQTTIVAERLKIAGSAAVATATAAAGVERSLMLSEAIGGTGEHAAVVASVVSSINEQLCRSTDANRFATLFLAFYDDRTRRLRYTNAGHNAPILAHADGTIERLTEGGMTVGAFDWATYEEAGAELGPEDLLLIFSDGISEAQNHAGEEYGEERLAQFAVEHRALSGDALRQALFAEIDNWSGTQERNDDQTIVIIKGRK